MSIATSRCCAPVPIAKTSAGRSSVPGKMPCGSTWTTTPAWRCIEAMTSRVQSCTKVIPPPLAHRLKWRPFLTGLAAAQVQVSRPSASGCWMPRRSRKTHRNCESLSLLRGTLGRARRGMDARGLSCARIRSSSSRVGSERQNASNRSRDMLRSINFWIGQFSMIQGVWLHSVMMLMWSWGFSAIRTCLAVRLLPGKRAFAIASSRSSSNTYDP